MKRSLLFILAAMFSLYSRAQDRPKLVVGIVVDQMRWDFLYRYSERYGPDGFKRLLKDGFSCENALVPFTPTYTAAGHSCVYTGSVAAFHGILGNSWYNRYQKRMVYCTEDSTVQTVGSTSTAGKMSPANMWSNTITDELKLAQNFRNKTVAISLKDRGAILPGGHTADAAYWFDNASGGWITSSFYMAELPAWAKTFNERKLPDAYLGKNWNTLFPVATYKQSTADSTLYEGKLPREDFTFPHITNNLTISRYDAFRYTPHANTYTFDMARATIENENMGKVGTTDFLAISFSTPDYIGHTFGPNSIEIEDTYLRLDKDLGVFLKFLDAKIGKGQYLVFLTADHGVAHNPRFMRDHRMPAGALDDALIRQQVNDSIQKYFGVPGVIEQVINYQVYLNNDVISQSKSDRSALKQYIISTLHRYPGIAAAYDLTDLKSQTIPQQLREMLTNGYNQKLSGDIQFIFKPNWFDGWETGTSHGTWNPYDTHIPLVWYGWKVKPGRLTREVYMTDIAATLAAMLKIQMPNASIGKVIEEVGK
jgi:predicted AlkP superfamily pyrophosphatase or phosphodiesterase